LKANSESDQQRLRRRRPAGMDLNAGIMIAARIAISSR